MGQLEQILPHKLTLNDRKHLSLTGVTDVISVDEDLIVLKTGLGRLVIQGQGLQLKNLSLDGGQVAVDGKLCVLSYEEPRQGGLRRLFR